MRVSIPIDMRVSIPIDMRVSIPFTTAGAKWHEWPEGERQSSHCHLRG